MTRKERKPQRLIRQKKPARSKRYFYITYLVLFIYLFVKQNEKCNECLEQIVWVISLLLYIYSYILIHIFCRYTNVFTSPSYLYYCS